MEFEGCGVLEDGVGGVEFWGRGGGVGVVGWWISEGVWMRMGLRLDMG